MASLDESVQRLEIRIEALQLPQSVVKYSSFTGLLSQSRMLSQSTNENRCEASLVIFNIGYGPCQLSHLWVRQLVALTLDFCFESPQTCLHSARRCFLLFEQRQILVYPFSYLFLSCISSAGQR